MEVFFFLFDGNMEMEVCFSLRWKMENHLFKEKGVLKCSVVMSLKKLFLSESLGCIVLDSHFARLFLGVGEMKWRKTRRNKKQRLVANPSNACILWTDAWQYLPRKFCGTNISRQPQVKNDEKGGKEICNEVPQMLRWDCMKFERPRQWHLCLLLYFDCLNPLQHRCKISEKKWQFSIWIENNWKQMQIKLLFKQCKLLKPLLSSNRRWKIF